MRVRQPEEHHPAAAASPCVELSPCPAPRANDALAVLGGWLQSVQRARPGPASGQRRRLSFARVALYRIHIGQRETTAAYLLDEGGQDGGDPFWHLQRSNAVHAPAAHDMRGVAAGIRECKDWSARAQILVELCRHL